MKSLSTRNYKTKILSRTALQNKLKKFRGKTVFTNGCFDILHLGHIDYLERARKLGDCLIVALNGDASVKKLKGPSRPVNSLDDRLKVVAALESVDFVTWFNEDTPRATIELLKPDVLVKGGDWKIHSIVGASEVLANGGKVYSLRFIKGRSTTSLLNKI